MPLRLKVVLSEDDVRRVTLPDPVDIDSFLGLIDGLVKQRRVTVHYYDDEGELIRVGTQDDLTEALAVMSEQNWSTLRVVVRTADAVIEDVAIAQQIPAGPAQAASQGETKVIYEEKKDFEEQEQQKQ